jgi:hypothetical protein
MGATVLTVAVGNPSSPFVTENLEFTVDSGAVYSVVPTPVRGRLGILPLKQDRRELKPMDLVL